MQGLCGSAVQHQSGLDWCKVTLSLLASPADRIGETRNPCRFCTDDPPRDPLTSASHEMLVLFRAHSESRTCDDIKHPWKCRLLFKGFRAEYFSGELLPLSWIHPPASLWILRHPHGFAAWGMNCKAWQSILCKGEIPPRRGLRRKSDMADFLWTGVQYTAHTVCSILIKTKIKTGLEFSLLHDSRPTCTHPKKPHSSNM